MRSAIVLLVLLLCAGGAARADEPRIVKSGEEAEIARLGSFSKDCTANPAPEVSVVEVAAHGIIRITAAKLKTNRFPACPGIEVPVKLVFYKSAPDYKGADKVILKVETKPGAETLRNIAITVE